MCFGFFYFIFAVAAQSVTLSIDLHHPTVINNAAAALGGGIDGHEKGNANKNLSSKSVKKMLQAGLKPLAYRLRTELGVEAWHWNPIGTWSDAKNHQGYWTSSISLREPIHASYGYRLARRGDTLDEANNDGYSRLDDGNSNTFWKSNPYLTSHYTGESDEQHPQWVVLDFGKPALINAARLHWREPYAKKFKIQYATGGDLYFGHNKAWHNFPHGNIKNGCGSSSLLDLGAPRSIQFVRILMTESSNGPRGQCRHVLHLESGLKSNALTPNLNNNGTTHAADPRDRMGYALQEIEMGLLKKGVFQDRVIHRPDQQQTMVTVSSTDPWHKASDLDEKTEQPGVDLVAMSRLGNNQPILWSLPVLYDTPENAAALVSYLKKRNYLKAHQRIELGEEPDGQHVNPKDFGELYCQVTQKIENLFSTSTDAGNSRGVPILRSSDLQPVFGGPSFVTIDCQPHDTTYRFDHRRWLRPFFKQLRHHHREKDFQFLTFEWYPFDDLLLSAPDLLRSNVGSLDRAMYLMWHGGIPKSMPLLITEYGYSVFSGEPEVKMQAALLNAEIAAEFLLAGGTTAYLYGYEPNTLECGINNSWGNLMMLARLFHSSDNEAKGKADEKRRMKDVEQGCMSASCSDQNSTTTPSLSTFSKLQMKRHEISAQECRESLVQLPTFYAAQMVTGLVKQQTTIFPVKSSQRDLTAYAFHQTHSNQWTLLCINKNLTTSYQLALRGLPPIAEKTSYSSKNYQWHADGPNGFPSKNEPPQHELMLAGSPIVIDPWSLTILKTRMD